MKELFLFDELWFDIDLTNLYSSYEKFKEDFDFHYHKGDNDEYNY